MRVLEMMRAWRRVPQQAFPALAGEITRKCPIGCSRCDANAQVHLGRATTVSGLNAHNGPQPSCAVDLNAHNGPQPSCALDLNAHNGPQPSCALDLADLPGDELVMGVLAAVHRFKAQQVLLTGGEPLIRHRELKKLIPLLLEQGVEVQLSTSALRSFPRWWTIHPNMNVVVAIDGLPLEHDQKRAPATYQRILCNVAGRHVTIHCAVTGYMMKRPGYLKEFLEFWTVRQEVKKVWLSLFTPQKGQHSPEALTDGERKAAISDMLRLRLKYPKLDMSKALIRQFSSPPASPTDCALARTTPTISADLKTPILPCLFGGNPDCLSCGYLPAMQAVTDRQRIWEGKQR
jgi:organic radical activating enzyme